MFIGDVAKCVTKKHVFPYKTLRDLLHVMLCIVAPESPLCTVEPPWRRLEGKFRVASLHKAQHMHESLLAGDGQTRFVQSLNVAG